MMDLESIKALSREAAKTAASEGLTPFIYWDSDEVEAYDGFPFPFLGEYVPPGWVEVNRHFVDSSGFGTDGEAALSVRQFRELIRARVTAHPGTGWAVVEAGQFQVYVGEFNREGQ